MIKTRVSESVSTSRSGKPSGRRVPHLGRWSTALLAAVAVALVGLTRAVVSSNDAGAEAGPYAFLGHIEEPGRLGVVDMAGTPLGNFGLPSLNAAGMFPSAFNGKTNLARTVSRDGTRILLNDDTVLDEHGKVIGRLSPMSGFGGALWADDSNLCQITISGYRPMAASAGPARLQAVSLSARPRFLADVGLIDATHTVTVLACDRASDCVVTAQVDLGGPPPQPHTPHVVSVTVVRWSNGAVMAHVPYEISPERVVASPDGRMLAEEVPGPSGSPFTLVRQEWGTAAPQTIDGFVPVAFSSDGERLVGYRPDGTSREHGAVVLDVGGQVARTIWQSSSALGAVTAVADPGSTRLLIAGSTPQGGEVYLIEPDGSSRHLASGFDEVLGDGPPPGG